MSIFNQTRYFLFSKHFKPVASSSRLAGNYPDGEIIEIAYKKACFDVKLFNSLLKVG